MTKHQAYLGLGANLGDREATILKAYEEIERLIGAIVHRSAFFYSEPWGFESAHSFVNTVIMVETTLAPHALLRQTQRIERLMGKRAEHATERKDSPQGALEGPHYHDRPIDIDILLYDDLTIDTPTLKIPQPLMQEREFVMIPLKEILTYADREPSQ